MPQTIEFQFEGHDCTVIVPDQPAKGSPYVWRTEFLYAFNQVDMALLARGYHVVYCSVSDEYGSPRSIAVFKRFRDFITEKYALSKKASLFGFSRGGLYACNYALAYPDDVACLYLDAPVLDLKSWPAGLGLGCGSPDEWEDCKKRVLGLSTVQDVLHYKGAPIDNLDALIATKIPVILVAGDSDAVVPFVENGAVMQAAYEKAGAPITVIVKPGCDHHPHSLEDPTPVVEFVSRLV